MGESRVKTRLSVAPRIRPEVTPAVGYICVPRVRRDNNRGTSRPLHSFRDGGALDLIRGTGSGHPPAICVLGT